MSKPNILIILADDIGVDGFRIDKAAKTVTAHVVGSSPSHSAGPVYLPTFERMLRSGVHFEQAWAHPVCTPTRASLWTGMQAWKTGLGYPLPGDVLSTNKNLTSLAQALKAGNSGYRCAMFGKWDMGGVRDPNDPAKDQNPVKTWGWDHFAGIYRGGLRADGTRDYKFSDQGRVSWERLNGNDGNPSPAILAKRKAAADALLKRYSVDFLSKNPDLRFYIWEKDVVGPDGRTAAKRQSPAEREFPYATEDQVEGAKAWLADNASAGPWCIALNLITPHDPLHIPPPGTYSETIFKDPKDPKVQELLVAMLESMDYYVNDLLEAIGDQLENTVVIFVGDNGTQDKDVDTDEGIDAAKGDDKGTEIIGGVHVPMIVADGGLMARKQPCFVVDARRSVGTPVHIVDIYDTVLDLAGVSNKPSNDSISMVPHLNQAGGTKRAHNFSQMYAPWRPNPQHPDKNECPGIAASASDGAYKLTCRALRKEFEDLTDRLYLVDLSGNPSATPYFEYVFSKLEGDENIPGSFTEKPIDALARNADGTTFSITLPEHAAKIMELYAVLSAERLNADDLAFPVIGVGAGPASVITLATGIGTDGRVDVFGVDPAGGPWVRTQSQPSGASWGGWRDLTGTVSQIAAIVEPPTGRLMLFGIGSDHALWYTAQVEPNGPTWTSWKSLKGGIKQIVPMANADGRLDVFAIGSDNALWHIWQTAPGSSTWSAWSSRGGQVKQIDVGRNADGRLEAFGIGTDDALWHTWQTAPGGQAWGGWASLGGKVKQISVGTNSDGRLEVFGIGMDDAVWQTWQTAPSNGWKGWASRGGRVKHIEAARNADGRITVFALDANYAIQTMSQTAPSNGWGQWASIGGKVSSFTVQRQANGSLAVFGLGPSHVVQWSRQNSPSSGSWSAWAPLDGSASSPQPVVSLPAFSLPAGQSRQVPGIDLHAIDFTIETKLRVASTGQRNIILGNWGSANHSWQLLLSVQAGGTPHVWLRKDMVTNGSDPQQDLVSLSATKPVQAGHWHHIALTFTWGQDRKSPCATFYVDGVAAGTASPTPVAGGNVRNPYQLMPSANPYLIGHKQDSSDPSSWFTGEFQTFGIYDTALTAAEIAALAKG